MSTTPETVSSQPHLYEPPTVIEVSVPIQALAFRESDGRYSIVVPELPGCISQGDTLDEAAENIVEAAAGWLACQHDHHRDEAIRSVTEPLDSESSEATP